MTDELLSHFPSASDDDSLMLDLGCGNGVHRTICEHAGFEWIGIDIESQAAPYLSDAHALPFENNTFEFVLSIAVLEHIENPFQMMSEVYRVLKPGGKVIGTVAFLEPYHSRSYFHHSPLGTLHILDSAGFEEVSIGPGWHSLDAQAQNALFPKMPDLLGSALIKPIKSFHKLWFAVGRRIFNDIETTELYRRHSTAGGVQFIGNKSEEQPS